MSWSANFPLLPRQFTYILNNFRLSKQEERMNKNKPKRNSRVGQKYAEIKLVPFSVGKLPFLHAHSGNSTNRSRRGFETNNWQHHIQHLKGGDQAGSRSPPGLRWPQCGCQGWPYTPLPRFLMMMVQTETCWLTPATSKLLARKCPCISSTRTQVPRDCSPV